jgi:hypothetical protein
MKKFLLLLSLSLMACAVELVDEREHVEESPASVQKSYAAPATLELRPANPSSCYTQWECFVCGTPYYTMNAVVERCSDGSWQVIQEGPCGEPCY